MIDGREVLAIATTLGLLPNIVEKDYVLSWILAGIFPASCPHRNLAIQRWHLPEEVLL